MEVAVNSLLEAVNAALNSMLGVVFFNIFKIFGKGDIVDLPFCICVLLIGYIYMSFRLHFVQFTRFKTMLKFTFGEKKNNKSGSSPIKILLTSIASCTGMNATAGIVFMVAVGGVGTIFWLAIIAFLSMPFRFSEVYLSHSYRSKNNSDSSIMGGPFDYLKKGLSDLGFKKTGNFLSLAYAGALVVSGVVGVSMYELNQCVVVIEKGFDFLHGKRLLLATIFTLIILSVAIGGTKRVENFLSLALPVLSITYVFVSIIVILFNYKNFTPALAMIYEDAMHPKSIAGGIVGSFCMCARKCSLSHETGLGTSGIVHALSPEQDSIKEAMRSMMTPLITGIIICFATALVLVTTGTYQNPDIMKDGVSALAYAFGSVCSVFPYIIITIIPMFTVNVTIGWSNYVVKCAQYLFKSKKVSMVCLGMFFVFAFIGGIINDFFFIMNVVDLLLMFILLINVPVVMLLSGRVYKAIKEYKF